MNTLSQKQTILAALAAKGLVIDPQTIAQNMSPSQLRSDSAALGVASAINFNFQLNSFPGTPSATSVLLQNNDAFIVTDIALMIKQCADTAAGHAKAFYHTFFSSLFFTGATNDPNMAAIYNSVLGVTIDRVQYIPYLPSNVFERIGAAQQGTTTTAYVNSASANATTTMARDEKTHALWGFFPISPFMIKGNNESQQFTLTLPTTLTLTADANANFASLSLNGYLISNYNSR